MIFGIAVGVVIGFIFKPQIEEGLHKLTRKARSRNDRHHDDY